MILKSLYLKNFLIHENTKIDFSEKGITVFIGENGSGKSSILEALTFALFGKSEKGSQANLVKWGKKQAEVLLDFQKGNDIYRIERTITLRGNRATSTGTVYRKKGDRFLPYYQKNISKEIPKLTGITQKIFSTSILVKQGDIEGLLKLSPKDRAKVLEEILDMTLYQLLSEKAGEKRRLLENKKETLEVSISDLEELENEKKEKEKKLKEIKIEKEKIEESLKEIKKSEEEVQKQIENILKEKLQQENIKNKIESLEQQIKNFEKEIEKNNQLLEEINIKEKKLVDLEEKVERLKEIESIIKDIEKAENLKERILLLEEKVSQIKEKERIKKDYEDIYTEFIKKENRYKEILDALNELSRLYGQIESIKNQIEDLKRIRHETLQRGLEIAKKLQKLKKIYKTLEKNPVIINELLRNNKEAIDIFQKQKEDLLKRLTELETEGKQLKEEISQLEQLEGVCPTCKRPVEEHTKEELLKDLKDLLEKKRKEYKQLKEDLSKLEERISVEKSVTPLLEEYKNIYDKHLEADKEINRLKAKLFVLDKEIKNKSSLEEEKKEIESFIKENKEYYQLYIEAERFLKSVDKEKIFNTLDDLKKQLEDIEKRVKDIDKDKIFKEYESLKQIEKQYFSIKEFVRQKDRILKDIERYRGKTENLKKSIEDLSSKILNRDYDNELLNLKSSLQNIQKRISELTEKLLAITELLGNIEKEKALIEKEIEKVKNIKVEIDRINEKIKKYQKIEFALGPKGIQKVIRENALYKLPKIVNIIFSAFDFPFQQIKFSDNFDISLLAPTVEKTDRYVDINAVSGGQRVALGLALRIAISRFLSNRSRFLILDEPTVHLDMQRRQDLINILIEMKEKNLVNQLILVTHDTEVEDAADTIYYVEEGKVRLVK